MPLAAAFPELVLVVVVALLLVLLLVNVQLYQNGHQARSFALNLPVVSAPVVAAIDWVLAFDVQAARYVDDAISGVIVAGVIGFGRLVVIAFNLAGAGILFLIHDTASRTASALALAVHLTNVTVPQIAARVADLERLQGAVSAAIRAAIVAAVATAVAGIERELAPVRTQAARSASTIETYRPLWDQLAAVPGGAAHTLLLTAAGLAALSVRVATLEAELTDTRSGVSALERQLAGVRTQLGQLAALGVISLAGAAVIENLLRFGRNPCEPCAGINLNDLEGRVASVELGNL